MENHLYRPSTTLLHLLQWAEMVSYEILAQVTMVNMPKMKLLMPNSKNLRVKCSGFALWMLRSIKSHPSMSRFEIITNTSPLNWQGQKQRFIKTSWRTCQQWIIIQQRHVTFPKKTWRYGTFVLFKKMNTKWNGCDMWFKKSSKWSPISHLPPTSF